MTHPSPHSDCAAKPVIAARPTTIRVNGVTISRAAIARETQNHPASKPIDAWMQAARALIVRELLLQEARRLAIVADPQRDLSGRQETNEEALIRQVVAQEVRTPAPDRETCLRYFEQNRSRFVSPDLHEVAHILLPLTRKDPDGAHARQRADALVSELKRDPGVFALLAKLHSACPSRDVGGHLGQIGPGQTVAEFDDAVRNAPVGAVCPDPVRTRFGWHVVRVDRRIAGQALPFEAVEARIATFLADRVAQVAQRQYLTMLAGRAAIEGFTLEASASPLVQ